MTSRTVWDPLLNKTVEISANLVDRLRGMYACGPTMPNGEPEFGWNQFKTPAIQHEAAAEIEKKDAEIKELRCDKSILLSDMSDAKAEIEQLKKALTIIRWTKDNET